jgi:hypothetical protein
MTLTVLTSSSAGSLVDAAMTGDILARAVLAAADRLLRQIQRRSRARALCCALCSCHLWRSQAPRAVVTLTPYDVVPVRAAVGMAICSSCAMDRSDRELSLAAVAMLRDGMLPDLRILPPMAAAGHA